MRIENRTPRADVEFPAVPRTADDFARSLQRRRARPVPGGQAGHGSLAQRRVFVWADILQGK